ncbi:MAG TPA: class I SAM-dependent methyltransferase [Vicinamibacterales bacterium]|nr:class I SAM-dependent methyltransferase [Vicinamibacterales bacterium]
MTRSDRSDATERLAAYRHFWSAVGDTFPDLGGAASTAYYRANEERLLREHLGSVNGRRILKTDLWDEAKNTRILFWAAQQGAEIHGIDISGPIASRAKVQSPDRSGTFLVADCRHIPYRSGSFDAVYSMGTIEHFDESPAAVREMWRVLKPGGRAIIGVPNRLDPFLRPLLVRALSAVRLYAYGFEKSYTRGSLRALVTDSGFDVVAETAILFMPGWLRMLDLACHVWVSALTPLTAALVRTCAFFDARFPSVRRHGYLIVAVGEKRG